MTAFRKHQFVWLKAGAVSAMGTVNPSEALVLIENPDYTLQNWPVAGPWIQLRADTHVPARIWRHVDVTLMEREK